MVLCAIGRYLCFALEGGPPCFPRGFSCPAVLWYRLFRFLFRLHGFHILRRSFPEASAGFHVRMTALNPVKVSFCGLGFCPVRSPLLGGISFDYFSSGYLDVSVRLVPSHTHRHG